MLPKMNILLSNLNWGQADTRSGVPTAKHLNMELGNPNPFRQPLNTKLIYDWSLQKATDELMKNQT